MTKKDKARKKKAADKGDALSSDELKLQLIQSECKGLKGEQRTQCVQEISSGNFDYAKKPAAAAKH